MFSLKDPNRISYLVGTDTKDIKKITVYIEDQNGNELSMESLGTKVGELLDKKKSELDPISALGAGLFGSDKSYGFVIGYVVKSVLNAYEESAFKKALFLDPTTLRSSIKLNIKTKEESISADEFSEFALAQLDELKTLITNNASEAFKRMRVNS